jgi:peptidoglycan/LPS O-acetylase OafA/YrhL
VRRPASGIAAALTAARILVAAALGLLAAGGAFLFVVLVSGPPDDGETTYVHAEAFGLALAGLVSSSCAVVWGLARASPRPVLAGSAGVAVAAAVFMVAVESKSPPETGIEYWRALFALVPALVVAAALVASRLRAPRPADARAG